MTAIDILTKKLTALGVCTEAIVLVVEAVTLAGRDSHTASQMSRVTVTHVTPDDVRKAACLRKRKQREREKQQRLAAKEAEANDAAAAAVTVTNVTRDKRDMSQKCTDLLPSFLSSSETLNKQKSLEEGSKHRKKDSSEKARARSTRMQPGAPLTEEFRQAAIKLGAKPEAITEMWVEHVDYWLAVPGERGVKTEPNGWLATWRNDVRRKLKLGTYNGRTKNGHATSAVGSAFDDLIARAEGRGGEDSLEPAENLRDISPQGR